MSLIKDIRDDLKSLDLTARNLRKFGIVVGSVFLLLSIFFYYKTELLYILIVFFIFGGFLVICGFLSPLFLNKIYKIWMLFAFVIGWFVSRVILTVLYFGVVTPLSVAAKIAGKQFLDIKFKDGKNSYWLKVQSLKEKNYEKLF